MCLLNQRSHPTARLKRHKNKLVVHDPPIINTIQKDDAAHIVFSAFTEKASSCLEIRRSPYTDIGPSKSNQSTDAVYTLPVRLI